jgi:hypothetical protein
MMGLRATILLICIMTAWRELGQAASNAIEQEAKREAHNIRRTYTQRGKAPKPQAVAQCRSPLQRPVRTASGQHKTNQTQGDGWAPG